MNTMIRAPKQLGAAIQRRRKALKLTQTDLSRKANLRQATISQIERGENAHLESLFAVLAALDLELTVQERTRGSSSDIEKIF